MSLPRLFCPRSLSRFSLVSLPSSSSLPAPFLSLVQKRTVPHTRVVVFRAGRMSFVSRVLLLLLLSSMVSTVTSQRLCGRRLTEALSVVCDHKYHRPTREQLNTVRTHSSGIATKCCRNRCPYEELSKYCNIRMTCSPQLPGPTAHWTDQNLDKPSHSPH
ncbi:hypothetical protein PRIPAC_87231 [Pristionchus pacificus]|uniref:IlGF domain-containing protein n=1 Tax=Pristionchus pacificus TaxID=54126 RepID=A0A2A6B3X4_PRIPA|nr:hypothetical protein PRIPAC_87231 [Pristionchus pacificus]|eukprot:PDM60577.1 hypothetical protein PRIPAC_53555 [Pristionchus pacificus]